MASILIGYASKPQEIEIRQDDSMILDDLLWTDLLKTAPGTLSTKLDRLTFRSLFQQAK